MKRMMLFFICLLQMICINGKEGLFSTAGFYELEGAGREVYSLNPAWHFYKGDVPAAHEVDFDDSMWQVVSIPFGLELLPEEASGCINYQGIAWYRKTFRPDRQLKGKKLFLHFEGIMGKSRIYLNGQLLKEHFDGYLPAIVDITDAMVWDKENVLAVMTDNSDDPLVLPGKPQQALDFTYSGGIYRDCWLVVHNRVFITDPLYVTEVAGGGVFLYYPQVSSAKAELNVKLHLQNEQKKNFKGKVSLALKDKAGNQVVTNEYTVSVGASGSLYVHGKMMIEKPHLWFPDSPYRYNLEISLIDDTGSVVDGMTQKTGVRKIEYKGAEGLFINSLPYTNKIVGVNRHQDFALIGNAVPNSLHWRDAKKLRDAGIRVVRCAHYPHDPAFLDACDELGLLVIFPIAGWQFWNKEPLFAERIYTHIRKMVRRDRNHASAFVWEPVLNETHFPLEYAVQAKKCVDEEYPYNQPLTAIDPGSKGSESYPVIFSHPQPVSGGVASVYNAGTIDTDKMYFTREFGDNVDDWNSHNSNSRVHRSWGESPMLQQAVHYAHPSYPFSCLEAIYASEPHHAGGTLWHAFDHQRGYHPQPFYGGIMDAFRQPKTSYYLFMAQRPVIVNPELPAETGPMIYIANEMTPFSPKDVTVYSNCEEVRLTVFQNGKQYTWKRSESSLKMPSPIIEFKEAFEFMELKALSRAGKQAQVYMLAEGLMDDKVVVTDIRKPSRRPVALRLRIDDDGLGLHADGSDIVTVIAEVVDKDGSVKRLNNNAVHFSIAGEGHLLGDHLIGANPVSAHWGSAPILVQATDRPGKIRIRAEMSGEGVHAIAPAEIAFESIPTPSRLIYDPSLLQGATNRKETAVSSRKAGYNDELEVLKQEILLLKKKLSGYELKEVEAQQESFGEQQ